MDKQIEEQNNLSPLNYMLFEGLDHEVINPDWVVQSIRLYNRHRSPTSFLDEPKFCIII
jgi:hypothetical protein